MSISPSDLFWKRFFIFISNISSYLKKFYLVYADSLPNNHKRRDQKMCFRNIVGSALELYLAYFPECYVF